MDRDESLQLESVVAGREWRDCVLGMYCESRLILRLLSVVRRAASRWPPCEKLAEQICDESRLTDLPLMSADVKASLCNLFIRVVPNWR